MPNYHYKARDQDGALRAGTMEASRKEGVADQLTGQGLIPVLIEELTLSPFSGLDLGTRFTRIKQQDLIIFSRQLATLMSAGLPFISSLATLEKQSENIQMKEAVSRIKREVEGGSSFSDALANQPETFSALYVSMVRAGETAGILDAILERLALLAEHDADTRARMKTAVRYPLIVLVVISAAFTFLVTFVVPKFATVFGRLKTELPFPTRVLININYAVQHYWHLMLLGAIASVLAVRWYVRTKDGRLQWDTLKLRLPVFGPLFQKVALSRFSRVFGAMQKSGISMVQTLKIAEETVGNVALARAVEAMGDSLRDGRGLSAPMEVSGLFPPLVVQMMAVGEETGQLDSMLNKISDYYDRDVEYTLRNLASVIEPVLILVVGGMVLFLALGIFLPMWDMMNLFQK